MNFFYYLNLTIVLGLTGISCIQAQTDTSNKVYSKYDFIPGDKILFYDDFSDGVTGDLPARWNTNGSGEIVTTNTAPGKWFNMTSDGYYFPETTGDFPENYTIEFDFISKSKAEETQSLGMYMYLVSGDFKNPNEGGAIPGKAGVKFNFESSGCSFASYADGEYKIDGSHDMELLKDKKYRMSITVQKLRVRLYIDEKKVFDIPRCLPEGFKYNILRFEQSGEVTTMISNLKIAEGKPDLRNKLITEGKLVSYGIYFDVNKDKLKPESAGTLKEIATALKENPTVKIKIVGHTDADGDDAANLDLSKRRAAAVKEELVKNFGIDASRIETDGKGETQKIAENNSPSNKALNRRVEFFKL